jgi:hypothetical protein
MPEEKATESRALPPAPRPLPPLREYPLEGKRFPVSKDIRRQLEGGIETLEAAHARYVFLEKVLSGRRWQQRTLRRLDALRELVRQEPVIEEALARLHQRTRTENWPRTEPALELARKVEKLRSRLEALTHRHLDMPANWECRLMDNLARIEQRLTETIAPPVSPEERVLHQGPIRALDTLQSILVMIGILVTLHFASEAFFLLRWCAFLAAFRILYRELYRPYSGWFWLTGKRLVWRSSEWRAPIHLPLHAIRPGGVRLRSSNHVEVELVDRRHFHLELIEDENAEQLVAMLKQHVPTSRPDVPRELVH